MKKQLGIMLCIGVVILLTGCEQAELTANKSSQKSKEAKGYVETLAKINRESKENIQNAVDKENKKIDEAMSTLEDNNDPQPSSATTSEDNNNSQSNTTMDNVPSQINMDFAKTCKKATIKTNKGDITIAFYNADAPVAVANFCTLADKGDYDNVIFHRVIKNFMIQGGDPDGTGYGGPGYKFDDELPEQGKYKVGSVAMANSGPNTNGSQFFIVSGENGVSLPPLYTLFGEVTEGLDVVDTIQNVQTGANDRPVEDVTIDTIELEMN